MHRPLAAAALLLLLAGCGRDADGGAPPAALAPADTPAAADAPPATAPEWRTNPVEGVTLRPGGLVTVETGPHTLLWPQGSEDVQPPYTVRATMLKHDGRIHEGYGLMFGARGVEGAEEDGHAYSYFLVRGDGSFLVKRRDGPTTPVVRDWTRHPRIHRESGGAPRPNELEARVGVDTTVFLVNGAEVARVPSAELATAGRAGLRIAHDVVVEVRAFHAGPAAQ